MRLRCYFVGNLYEQSPDFGVAHNALLRGEQRNTEAAADHLNRLNQRMVKMPRVANPS